MTAAVGAAAASSQTAFNALVSSSQSSTTTAEQTMAANVANGVNASAASQLTGNFTTFLQILTTQLQNQDPTAPMDTDQFTQELVEFSGVEQQLNTNSLLQQLVTASGASGVKSLLGYVGQYVEVPSTSNQILIQNGQSDFSYTLPSAAQNVTLTVQNASGQTVATLNGPANDGANNVAWNGQDSNGDQLADGVYTLAISATDANGNAITPSNVSLIGQVTGVQPPDSSGNDLMLGPNLTIDDANISAVFSASTIPQANSSSSSTSQPSS
jgi:flagellar basal-body rod modification protein FlgD